MHALAHIGTSAGLYYRVLGLVGRHRGVCGDGCRSPPRSLETLLLFREATVRVVLLYLRMQGAEERGADGEGRGA